MSKFPSWVIGAVVLVLCALPLRFYFRGYSYIAYTLLFLAAVIVLSHLLPPVWRRVMAVLVSLGLVYFCLVEIPICAAARTGRNSQKPYLVVLGAEVVGERPSRSLTYRINAAVEYLTVNPESVAIVSGGQGENEEISEAQCMFEYITAAGIAPERVIREDKATSTMENLRFSFDIIRQRGDEPDGNVAILSSSYHLYRAELMAQNLGVEAEGVASYPGWFLLALNFYIREAFGVTHLIVFGS